jgi:hypothetical protein
MPKANDLEGMQDQGGKHGGQAGTPRPAPGGPSDQGIVRQRGETNLATKSEHRRSVAKVRRVNHPPNRCVQLRGAKLPSSGGARRWRTWLLEVLSAA